MLPRRGWVGWIEEHSKVLGAISVWIFVAFGGIGALVASASGGHRGGEILSDVQQLPQQFHPTYEGLSAWADLANRSGGICGRQIRITERNDQALPNNYTSDYQSMSSQVFSFVATESLQDGAEYQSNP